ncbi:conserved hypothetical protein [Histoplasma mississippiense (nom. inval.)]|uniref:conserved hypothetical protein n=1 Tax=Ajellomyces capsulatus (strain NAm1 / WU24) TaxID=2059318 RepID=UPI000157C5E3|nr:conserved hypothetical protein [Histoplasma mississippiense (nom. inval.)]EDN08297.1 conserved hypothetical protein [Histoplasma mississippiense (nom. inval.)]
MSSMIEGSEDGAREDEPQFENNDHEQFPVTPGWEANNEDEPLSATNSRDPALRESDSALHSESGEVLSVHNREVNKGIGSGDDFGSIPDDTPSVQDSILSSRSSAFGLRGSPSNLSSSPHRPFDRRFQSRLSVSLPGALRPRSPSLIGPHSRNSSVSHVISSTPDLLESPAAPWEVVRWTKLRKITGQAFSEVGKRNFGQPACISISTAIVIGTAKGIIMVFDYQQNLNAIIGPGTKAIESGPITSLAISADHTTIAAGHGSGHIFTWEISKPARPFLHIPPIPTGQLENKRTDGHISGVAVIHLGFLGTRHTALVSADDHGMAFSHLANRGMGAVGRVVRTTRILGRYPDAVLVGGRLRKPSSVLAFSPLPLGNVPQATDPIGLVALLTPYLLVIVSTTPVARTQYKAPRPKEVAAHSALTAALAWFPAIKLKGKNSEASKTKLVYCWSNVLTVLEVSEVKSPEPADKDRPPSFEFKPRSRWRAEEGIVAVQWISRSVLAVMTITQQLLILEDNTLRMTDSFDLIHKHIYHVDIFSKQLHSLVEQLDEEDESMHGVIADAFYMSFRAYKGRLFLLGVNDMSVGSLSNWADRLLSLMEGGDFIGAIRLATSYYTGNTEKLTVGLPEEDNLRHQLVQEKLLEMISASIRYAFGRNQEAPNERLSPSQLEELADSCIAACDALQDYEFLFNEVYSWYEECGSEGIILDTLEPYIVQGSIRTLPPTAVKSLITHYITNHTATRLEEIICLLDTSTIDIDQVTSLCKQHNLYDAFIYVWTRALGDYVGPLVELIHLIHQHTAPNVNGNADVKAKDLFNAMKMFPYLSYVLTGRIYPTGEDLPDLEASKAKAAIYDFLFSGISVTSSSKKAASQDSFLDLQTILEFDTPSFMSMLNEAFEDSFLNDATDQASNGAIMPTSNDSPTHGLSINRQYLISILLEIMESSNFGLENTVYLDMFIARNLPKYPQYILLSGSTLQQILMRLCRYPNPEMIGDCQLSAFVDILKVGDLKLDAVLPSMESSGVIDAAIILLARQGEVRAAMDRLIKHLGTLEAGLSGLLQNANESPDSASMAEAVVDLIQSLDKYTHVGIWLCQQQSNASRQSRGGGKSNKTGAATPKLELSFEENLWLDLIEMVVRIARNMSSLLRESSPDIARDTLNLKPDDTRPGEISSFFRVLVQQVFTALLTSTTKSGDRPSGKSDMSFLLILRAFLTRVAAASPSLSELRSVIASIFSAYTYEESLLSLANAMLDKDLFVHCLVADISITERVW